MKRIAATTLKSVLFFIGWAIVSAAFIPLPNSENTALWRLWAEITPLLSVIVFTTVFWLIEKKQVKLNFMQNPVRGLGAGIIGGILWLGCTMVILVLFDVINFEGYNQVPMLAIWLIASTLNVIMQELLVRGYLYQMIKQKHNVIAATIVTTALFAVMHGGAFEAGVIPVLNVVTMSLMMTVVLEYTGSIIAPIIMHAIWNGIGSIILGGVSLADDYPHLLNVTFSGNNILSGGVCKIEGSIVVLVINILMVGVFTTLKKRERA